RGPAPAARARLQPRQLPPHPGPAGRDRAVVADEPAGEGGEDRREGDRPRPARDLPDGGGGGAARAVRPHPRPDREAASARSGPMLILEGCNGGPPGVEVRPECVLGVPQSGRIAIGDIPDPRGGRHNRVLPPSRAENPSPRGRDGGIWAPRRGWTPSIWELSVRRGYSCQYRTNAHPHLCE